MTSKTFVDKETIIDADWLNDVDRLAYGPATKTIAKTLTPVDGAKIYPQGSEGPLIGGTGQVAGFYNDDSATDSYGTKFKPTGGDGSTGYKRPDTEPLNVFHFMLPAQIASVLKWDGVEDVTTSWKEAIEAGNAQGRPVHFPSGRHVITDTILGKNQTQLFGEHKNMGFVAVSEPSGTYIDFQPASLKSLFEPTGLPAILKSGYVIDGFYIQGNSTNATGNSNIGIDVDNITKSAFRNLRVQGFRTCFRCVGTINNDFHFIQTSNAYVQSVLYDGGISTTDTWTKCYLSNAPVAVETVGLSVNIRWVNTLFESMETTGVNLVKEVNGWEFIGCYSENIPANNDANGAMFRVGHDGTTLAVADQLRVIGGEYAGRNAGGVGSFLDVDFTNGVTIGGFKTTRFTNGVKTSSNTQTQQIVSNGWVASSISNVVTDETKMQGYWPADLLNGSTRNGQNAAFRQIAFLDSPTTPLNDYREFTSASQSCTGAITTVSQWDVTKIGNQVTLTLPSVTGGALAQTFFAFGALLSVSYRPSADISFPCAIYDNNANQAVPGTIQILSATGQIRVYKDLAQTATYTVSTTAGLGQSSGTSVSWTI